MATIRLATAVNVHLFQSLSAALNSGDSINHLIDGDALEDEFGRFRVWSGNLGALQKGHSALDYRLRDSPLLSSNALTLLKELENNIEEAIAIVTGARLPYEQQKRSEETEEQEEDDFFSEDEDEGSDDGAPKTELEQRFREIVDIIDNLYRLSVRIRTPTIRSRSLKASSYQPKDPETGVDVLDQYAAFDLQYTRELVRYLRSPFTNEVKEDDPIIERLSKAITLRRRQYKYWKRHRDKLGVSTVLDESLHDPRFASKRPSAPNHHETLEVQPGNPAITALKDVASEKTGKTMLSGTEATRHYQSLDNIVDSRSVTSYATTVRDLTGREIDLPPPPKAADGEKDFECPYCFIICPARYGKGRAWRTHVLQDLQPYLCTYLECESSEQLFRSRREWSDHEASHRKAWRCPEHPTAVYQSKSGLEDHMHRKHSGSFPDSQLASIINVSETSTVDTRDKCPICFVEVDMEGGLHLQNHVANHLERLAAFALPRNVNEDEDGGSSVASRGRSESSGSQDLSDVSFQSDVSFREEGQLRPNIENFEPSLAFALQEDISSRDVVTPSSQGLLSAEMLGNLPDSSQTSQKRLDILFPSHVVEDDDFDEKFFDEIPEVVDNRGTTSFFRAYLLSQPGFESVRFLCRFGWWIGYAIFKDEASALRQMETFDYIRYPAYKVTRGVSNKAALKFSFPGLKILENEVLALSRQSTGDQQDGSSTSTKSISYNRVQGIGDQMPILPASEIPTLSSLYQTQRLLQRDQSYAPYDTFNQIVSFINYDITRLKVDAIVNSANVSMKTTRASETLNHQIHKKAGPDFERECIAVGKVKTGQVRITSGCDLPSTYVIHAARPQYSGSKGKENLHNLTECYRNSLRVAMNHEIKTVAFPCLATGGCGFPSRVAARIALQEIREFLDTNQGYAFERIIFCVCEAVDQKAYEFFLPVFFPPTHGDLKHATPFEPYRYRFSLAARTREAYCQIVAVHQKLTEFSKNIEDFPQAVLKELSRISLAFDSLNNLFPGIEESIQNLNGLIISDVGLICSVVQRVSGGVTEIIEQTKYTRNFRLSTPKSIWDDYNLHMKNIHMKNGKGMDLLGVLGLCRDFVQSLNNILARDGVEPYEMAAMRGKLGSYRFKLKEEGRDTAQDLFDEALYAREFQRDATTPNRTDVIKYHQVPSIARLYQIGDLEYKPTMAIASANFNHIVCLLKGDITRVESDVIVNSTDISFSSWGSLDHMVFKKGGPAMQQACSKFGRCKEGDVKVTPGFFLPAKHVIHVIPPETYRSETKDVFRKLYREILYTAVSLKASSVTIPTIGFGSLIYPKHECTSLALEEVKYFLESAEPVMSLEKIIFCVFEDTDELVYKSLLPVYFPPVDTNVNEALPSMFSLSSSSPDPKNATASNQPARPSKRTLFSTVRDMIDNIRVGKQPVSDTSRTLNSVEKHALTSFENHAHDCSTCNHIAKIMCADGFAMAQAVLQCLYMSVDESVYSLYQEEGKRIKVELPSEYQHSRDLLVTLEKSYRDGDRSNPFARLNQAYTRDIGQDEQYPELPPEVTVYPVDVTVFFLHWSGDKKGWVPLPSEECSIHFYPAYKAAIYSTDEKNYSSVPILEFDLTTVQIVQCDDSVLFMYGKEGDRRMRLSCKTPAESEALLRSLVSKKPREPAKTSVEDLGKPRTDAVTPLRPGYEKAMVFLFTRSDGDGHAIWQPLLPEMCSIHIYPGKVEVYQADESTQARDALLCYDLTPMARFDREASVLTMDNGCGRQIRVTCKDDSECEVLLQRLEHARDDASKDMEEASSPPTRVADVTIPTIVNTEKFPIASILAWSEASYSWESLHQSGECTVRFYPDNNKAEVYRTNRPKQSRVPLLLLDFTPLVLVDKIAGSNILRVDNACKKDLLVRCRTPEERELLYARLELAMNNIGASLAPPSILEAASRPQTNDEAETTDSGHKDGQKKTPSDHGVTIQTPKSPSTVPANTEAATSTAEAAPTKQHSRSNAPAPLPTLVLSDSDLSTINIDDFFNLATPSSSPSPPSSSKLHPLIDVDAIAVQHPRPGTPDHEQPAPIPPGIRWTKIDIRLVDPRALREAGEEFEEREDSVIVYRMLSREEVLALAVRTRRSDRWGVS